MPSDKVKVVAVAGLVICYITNVLTLKADGILFGTVIGAICLIIGVKYGYNVAKGEQATSVLEAVTRHP